MSRWPRTPSRYRSLATARCPMGDNPLSRPLRRTNQPTHLPARARVRCHRQPLRPAGPTSRRHLHLRPGPLRRSPGTHRRRSRSCRTSCNWPPRPTRLATERRTIPAPQIHAVVCDKMLPLRRRRLRPTPTRQADITIRQLTPANRPTTSTPHRPGIVPCPSLASGGGRRTTGIEGIRCSVPLASRHTQPRRTKHLDVPGHQVVDSRLIGGRPPRAVCRRFWL